MATLYTYVPIVQTEADSLAQFLDTLSADDWQRPSACDLWTIRDVVAHLIWVADFYTDTMSRGMRGDISRPADRPPGDAPDPAAMPAYFNQHAIKLRACHPSWSVSPTAQVLPASRLTPTAGPWCVISLTCRRNRPGAMT